MSKTASPKGGRRGCLCKDGTYKKACCDGELQSQGIGSDKNQSTSNVNNVDTTRVISN